MTNWFTSDTHFNHANIIGYCGRPFQTVFEMNQAMLERWNERVRPGDTVWHLGDFAFGHPTVFAELLGQLAGNMVLVAGNHDSKKNDHYFRSVVRGGTLIELDGLRLECVHNPRHVRGIGDLALCGHVHDKWRFQAGGTKLTFGDGQHYTLPVKTWNVGVDVWDFRPVLLSELLEGR